MSFSSILNGVLGGGLVTLFYEAVVKTSQSRRRLAHVLAQEVGHNLQMLVLQKHVFEALPKELPGDFKLATEVYTSVVARLGELPDDLTGEVLLFYQRMSDINARTQQLSEMVDHLAVIKSDPDRHGGVSAITLRQAQAQRAIQVYKQSFDSALVHGDLLIRKLRVAETPLGKIGYRFRKKPTLDVDQSKKAVQEHVEGLLRARK